MLRPDRTISPCIRGLAGEPVGSERRGRPQVSRTVGPRSQLCMHEYRQTTQGGNDVRRVYVSTVLEQPIGEVWAVLGDFHRVDTWMGTIHHSSPENAAEQAPTVGSIRRLTVGDDRHTTRE